MPMVQRMLSVDAILFEHRLCLLLFKNSAFRQFRISIRMEPPPRIGSATLSQCQGSCSRIYVESHMERITAGLDHKK